MRNVRFWLRSVFVQTILVCSTGDLKDSKHERKKKSKNSRDTAPLRGFFYDSFSRVRTFNSFAAYSS